MQNQTEQGDYDENKVMDAWERYLTGGTEADSANHVRSVIHESWFRSVSSGVKADSERSPEKLDKDHLEYRLQKFDKLRAASRQTFANIGKRLNGTNAILLLTDSNGTVIDEIGDKTTLFAGKDINLSVGGNWNEGVIGTNGIGTALSTGKPVFVHGAEHFCLGIKSWSCSGAPIRDPLDGSVIGVIDLSGPVEIFQPYTAALIAEAAREIEKALAEINYEDQVKLLEAFFSTVNTVNVKEDVVILDKYGRIVFCKEVDQYATDFQERSVLRRGAQLIDLNLDKINTSNDIYSALPKEFQECTVNILRKEGIQGAMLVFDEKGAKRKAGKKELTAGTAKQRTLPILQREDSPEIIGKHPPLLEAIETVKTLANSPIQMAILIEGETGVGKELFANLIHHTVSQVRKAPFITVNCGAISAELIGGELFGHVPGSFTGALKEGKAGKFELANGGVLCLDEIGELPLEIQPYLLRVLEERVVYRISADKGTPLDITFVAATNRVLKDEVAKGKFRQDLYYRISPATIKIPPLRERGEDILLLAEHFNQQMTRLTGLEPLKFTEKAESALLSHNWHGNVRELKNIIENLHILHKTRKVRQSDLPVELTQEPEIQAAPPKITHQTEPQTGEIRVPVSQNLVSMEKEAIIQALKEKNGNLSQVAKHLGISRPTLYRKMDIYKIKRQFS